MLLALIAGAAPGRGRGPALSYVFAFALAYFLLHLDGTGLGALLQRHTAAAALALALVLALEGVYLLGVESLWSRLRRTPTKEQPAADWLEGALLGLGAPFALTGLGGAALARAAVLGDAGELGTAWLITVLTVIGAVVVLLVLGHVANLVLGRWRGPWPHRAAGAAFLLVAAAIAAGWVG